MCSFSCHHRAASENPSPSSGARYADSHAAHSAVSSSTAEDVTDPLLWDTENDVEIPAFAKNEGGAKTNNPALNAFNGADLTVSFNEPIIEDNVWTGTMTVTTSSDNSATASADGAIRYGQILASQAPVYLTEATSSYTLTTTVTVISGTLTLELAEGGEYTFQDLAGTRASATITR